MQIQKRVTFSITAIDKEAERIVEFRKKHPHVTHKDVYLRGVETIEKE